MKLNNMSDLINVYSSFKIKVTLHCGYDDGFPVYIIYDINKMIINNELKIVYLTMDKPNEGNNVFIEDLIDFESFDLKFLCNGEQYDLTFEDIGVSEKDVVFSVFK